MSHDNNSRLVYSTDGGIIKEQSQPQSTSPFPTDGVVRIRRETKGRKGAGSSPSTASRPNSKRASPPCSRKSAAPAAA